MSKIIISEFMDQGAVDLLSKNHEVIYDKTLVDNKGKLLELVESCDAIIVRNRTQVKTELLTCAKKLKVVGRLGVGLDNIDVSFCNAHSIKVIPATGANNISVAEYVLTGLLMLTRDCYHRTDDIKNGLWPRETMIGNEIYGKTLGLIGFGGIARDVAILASVFQMNIIAHDVYLNANDDIWHTYGGKPVLPSTLNDLLKNADMISIHLPLTEDTHYLINKENIHLLKKEAIIINSSRGGIIDENVLAQALINNDIKGAMLDVFEQEPFSTDSMLKNAPRCIMTPHIAGVTQESNTRISAMIANQVDAALRSYNS